jgi:photosynthetic reaction center H subunit
MGTGAITAYIDVAQLVLYLFWILFFGLVYYLVRENHREGYPMDSDRGVAEGWPRAPAPKTFLLDDGQTVQVPRGEAPPQALQAQPVHRYAGSPVEPVGDPLSAGVGPGSWVGLRPDAPDRDHHGLPKIQPLALLPEFGVSDKDPDPRGLPLLGADGEAAGVVRDLWMDRSEMIFRYLEAEVALPGGGTRLVLVPTPFVVYERDAVHVGALMSHQFAGVPPLKAPGVVTMLEEERICAYYGAGTLYADPRRAEPLI